MNDLSPPRRARLSAPPRFAMAQVEGPRVTLTSDTGAVAHVFVLEEAVMRVLLLAHGIRRREMAGN